MKESPRITRMNANQSRPSGRRLRETLPRERIASLMAIPNFDASASKFGAASDFRVQPCSIAPASWSAPVLWRFGILCGESQRSVSRALGKPGSFRGVLPHPGPLPLGEGEPAPSACSRRTHRWHRIRRLTLPPLPAGEGRGEGERRASPPVAPTPAREFARISATGFRALATAVGQRSSPVHRPVWTLRFEVCSFLGTWDLEPRAFLSRRQEHTRTSPRPSLQSLFRFQFDRRLRRK